jgi:uncharacterized membrane protein YhhN
MIELVVVAVTTGAVASLLAAIRAGDRVQEVASKAVASASFVALGLLRVDGAGAVGGWIVAGLVLCAVGDLLLLGSGRSFDLGLLSFLLGHCAYIGAFAAALPPSAWWRPAVVPLVLAAAGALRWLWPHLGRRRLPVVAYIVAISVMLWGAVSVVRAGALPATVAPGAILFYLSDLAVARHRFVKAEFLNRGIGLPLYYAGQVLIAMSI